MNRAATIEGTPVRMSTMNVVSLPSFDFRSAYSTRYCISRVAESRAAPLTTPDRVVNLTVTASSSLKVITISLGLGGVGDVQGVAVSH